MIYIEATGGLCNRLRVILSYYQYCNNVNKKLMIYWPINHVCNGNFNKYFMPLKNVNITDKYYNFPRIDYRGCEKHTDFKKINCNLLKPKQFLVKKINKILKNIDDNKKYIAVHIRRTDHSKLAKKMTNSHLIKIL